MDAVFFVQDHRRAMLLSGLGLKGVEERGCIEEIVMAGLLRNA
jgi:hypothetical protein